MELERATQECQVTAENRFAYLLPLAIILGIAAWWEVVADLTRAGNRVMSAAITCFLAIDIVVGTTYFAMQRNYYSVLTPGLVQGFQVLRTESRPTQLVAVSPMQHDWELGWWVEGVVRRPTIYAGSPVWLNYADERERNRLANEIFSPPYVFQNSLAAARGHGVSYLLVDKAWSGYAIWSETIDRTSIVYENSAVMVVATVASGV